jgi:hypothetical protein
MKLAGDLFLACLGGDIVRVGCGIFAASGCLSSPFEDTPESQVSSMSIV